jgi:hypothetical protein
VTLKARIKLTGINQYELAAAARASLNKTMTPVTVTLTIGDDTGNTTTVPY